MRENNKNSKKVIVGNTEYPSMSEAERLLGMSRYLINKHYKIEYK